MLLPNIVSVNPDAWALLRLLDTPVAREGSRSVLELAERSNSECSWFHTQFPDGNICNIFPCLVAFLFVFFSLLPLYLFGWLVGF